MADPVAANRLRIILLAIGTLMIASRSASGQCVTWYGDPSDFLRSENETQLLATVLAPSPRDTVRLARRPLYVPWNQRGQLVSVAEADGPGAHSLGADSLAVVARWGGLDDLCQRQPARDTLATGTRHLFTLILRADSLWIDGRPTFDERPFLLGDLSLPRTAEGSSLLRDYRQLMASRPSREEWERDCRPGVRRVERWLDFHPEASRSYPFGLLRQRLRPTCELSVENHATRLERWEPAAPVPDALRAVFAEQGCRDDPDEFAGIENAVDGHFVEADAQQWVVTCAGTNSWRLLIVVLESPPRLIELARLAGHDWLWLAGAAPPQYFDWMSSRQFGSGRWGVPRPKRGVALLSLMSADKAQTLAFFETPAGWVSVGIRCCHWPE